MSYITALSRLLLRDIMRYTQLCLLHSASCFLWLILFMSSFSKLRHFNELTA